MFCIVLKLPASVTWPMFSSANPAIKSSHLGARGGTVEKRQKKQLHVSLFTIIAGQTIFLTPLLQGDQI